MVPKWCPKGPKGSPKGTKMEANMVPKGAKMRAKRFQLEPERCQNERLWFYVFSSSSSWCFCCCCCGLFAACPSSVLCGPVRPACPSRPSRPSRPLGVGGRPVRPRPCLAHGPDQQNQSAARALTFFFCLFFSLLLLPLAALCGSRPAPARPSRPSRPYLAHGPTSRKKESGNSKAEAWTLQVFFFFLSLLLLPLAALLSSCSVCSCWCCCCRCCLAGASFTQFLKPLSVLLWPRFWDNFGLKFGQRGARRCRRGQRRSKYVENKAKQRPKRQSLGFWIPRDRN